MTTALCSRDWLAADGASSTILINATGALASTFPSVCAEGDAGNAENGPPIVFRGALHTIDERALTDRRHSCKPLLRAPGSVFQASLHPSPGDTDGVRPRPTVTTGALLAASALALAGGGRAVVCGAARELFSDGAFRRIVGRSASMARGVRPGNERWAERMSAWLMHDAGVYRIAQLRWTIQQAATAVRPPTPPLPVGKEARGTFGLEERVNGQWLRAAVPHGTSCRLALELSQLGQVRARALASHVGDATFEATLHAPASAGTYELRVKQCDVGEGFGLDLDAGGLVVRPLRSDEHSRFLVEALPYYCAIFASMLAAPLFAITFLRLPQQPCVDAMSSVSSSDVVSRE